jgi:hypothetical protein
MLSRLTNEVGFAVSCLTCILLAHYAAVLPHEYAHSFMAFELGFKSDPFIIHFGGRRLVNLLFLTEIDEHVDYAAMFARGAGPAAALVGFAGPGLGNGTMYLLSLRFMQLQGVREHALALMWFFWFNLMNVGNFYDYVPIRTFVSHGDIGHITQGLGVSAWVVLIVLGVPTATAMYWLFARTIPLALARLAPKSPFRRRLIVTLSVVAIFGYFGLAGWSGYGEISHALSAVSLALIPVALILCWPTRGWMRTRIETLEQAES